MAYSNSDLMKIIDELVPPLLAHFSQDGRDSVDGARRSGEWQESIDNLVCGLRDEGVRVSQREMETLRDLCAHLGLGNPTDTLLPPR